MMFTQVLGRFFKNMGKFGLGILGVMGVVAIALPGQSIQPREHGVRIATKPAQTFSINQTFNPVFKPIIPILKKKTQVPLWLPSYIPESDGDIPLYAQLEIVTAKNYSILLGFDSQCNGATACRLGSISGEKINSQNKLLKGKKITLSRKRQGYFVDATCGANCSDSTISWQEKGYLYRLAIKAGDLKTLVKMANSTILIPSS
jgi:hypothetical protein